MGFIPFTPSRIGKGQHIQTITAQLFSKLPGYMPERIGLLNEHAVLPSEDSTGDRLLIHIHRFVEDHGHAKPVVVMVHGMEGDANSIYIIKMADRLLRAGFNVIRVNLRTCGESQALARNAYYSGLTIDILTILEYARKYVSRHVALVGISLGANIVLKLLGEDASERRRQVYAMGQKPNRSWKNKQSPADIFVAISPPLEMERSCEILDGPNCKIYRDMFLKSLKERALRGVFRRHKASEVAALLEEITSFFEFDHNFTAPHAGFEGAVEYYEHCASKHFVSRIQIPGLVLHAKDDPLIHMSGWEEANFSEIPHITSHLTEHGGHVGWIARKHPLFPDRRWMDYRVTHFLSEWRDSL